MRNWKPEWPPAEYVPWLAPGAVAQAEGEYGKGLDKGAIREGADGTEILWDGGQWIPLLPGNKRHVTAANTFARIGPGWSAGHHPDTNHNSGRGYYETVHGERPGPYTMLNVDVGFNKALFLDLQRKATAPDSDAGAGSGTGTGTGTGSGPGAPVDLAGRLDRIDTLLRRIAQHVGITG